MICMFKEIHYCLLMYLETLETITLKYIDPAHFYSASGLACLKKTGVTIELLTDNDMLLMVEKGIGGQICRAIHRYATANNKFSYDKNIESSYLTYVDANNLHGWAMSQKNPVNGFEWENSYLNLMRAS